MRGVVALGRDKARQQGPAAASGSESGQGEEGSDWEEMAKGFVRGEMARRGFT